MSIPSLEAGREHWKRPFVWLLRDKVFRFATTHVIIPT
jgi:hypothetical protein